MTGFGLTDVFWAGQSLRNQRLWRDDLMLHQLTFNGHLLLTANHDRLWLALLAPSLGQPSDTSWERLASLLELLPASRVRRTLWNASFQWWLASHRLLTDLQAHAYGIGAHEELAQLPDVALWRRRVERVGEQLAELEWCRYDEGDEVLQSMTIAQLWLQYRRERAKRVPRVTSV